jgi:hypothetical protein
MSDFETLMRKLIEAGERLIKYEAAQLPYCGDPEDSCSEDWAEAVREFREANAAVEKWLNE